MCPLGMFRKHSPKGWQHPATKWPVTSNWYFTCQLNEKTQINAHRLSRRGANKAAMGRWGVIHKQPADLKGGGITSASKRTGSPPGAPFAKDTGQLAPAGVSGRKTTCNSHLSHLRQSLLPICLYQTAHIKLGPKQTSLKG